SKPMAIKRFLSLEKKLSANTKLSTEYHKVIQTYISHGWLSKSNASNETSPYQYYLPHHAVEKESSSTTSTRIVFDGSCKTTDGTSLNDRLLTGKKLQKDIRDVLFNWRNYPFSLNADVEKMYLMFKINPHHHPYQKIVWRFSSEDPIEDYVLT
ncbi:hypothetical protein, partial [Streptomyces djakartensis]|uniref:hypothetical protein n=1 Tax=Streptomyces djakartensis TaxID=68193 RepID=UPI0034DF1254